MQWIPAMGKLVFCLAWVVSFSGFANAVDVSSDLLFEIQKANAYVKVINLEEPELDKKIDNLYNLVFNLKSGHFNLKKAKQQGPLIIQALWDFRLDLHRIVEDMYASDLLLRDYSYGARVVRSARNVSRAARYMEDMVGELIGMDQTAKILDLKGFEGGPLHVLVNPKFPELAFKSGDIITVRGGVFNSAAIARIGDIDSQFSHQAMVYEDANTKEQFIVESVISQGARSYPLKEFLEEHSGSRLALFRYKAGPQPLLPHVAAQLMYERINGKKIPYNFSMNLNDESKLFCSQIAYLGFEKASAGRVKLNLFPTVLSSNYKQFFDDIGVTAKTTYAPGDIELDPRFEIVAEWRNFAKTRTLRNKDLILTKIFSWLDKGDLTYRVTRGEIAIGGIISTLRGIPLIGGLPLINKASPDQSAKSLAVVTAIQRVGDKLEEVLERYQQKLRSEGLPEMYPREIMEFVEVYVQENSGEFDRWVK